MYTVAAFLLYLGQPTYEVHPIKHRIAPYFIIYPAFQLYSVVTGCSRTQNLTQPVAAAFGCLGQGIKIMIFLTLLSQVRSQAMAFQTMSSSVFQNMSATWVFFPS